MSLIEEIPSTTKEKWEGKMPLSESGKKVMANMKDEYGEDEGERAFYASKNAGKPGSEKWEGKRKGKIRRHGHKKNMRKMGTR